MLSGTKTDAHCTPIATPAQDATVAQLNLTPHLTYYLRVRAVNDVGSGAYSNASATLTVYYF